MKQLARFIKQASKKQYRASWIGISICSVFLVAFSHYVLQIYGYMQPCEQCVYIRYAFVVLALGASIVAICPSVWIVGYVCVVYACVRGMMFAWRLEEIAHAMKGDDVLFGIGGCSMQARFDFGLALDAWFPSLFLPSGDCGVDMPFVPHDVVLSGVRAWFVEMYSDGWYLIPMFHIGTLAQCCLVIFGACLLYVGWCMWICGRYARR